MLQKDVYKRINWHELFDEFLSNEKTDISKNN